MAAQPGLVVGANKPTEVVTTVESDRPEAQATMSDKPVEEVSAPAEVNTEDTAKPETTDKPEEQPVSERLSKRVESVVNERNAERDARIAAEERARLLAEQLQRVVNVPSQPQVSEIEMLRKKFPSYGINQTTGQFDPSIEYPTLPAEFSKYNVELARIAAHDESLRTHQEAMKSTAQERDQAELLELKRNHPEVETDYRFRGSVVAEKSEAQRKGIYLSWNQAADKVKEANTQATKKKAVDDAVSDTQTKNEAYIETTKGASSSRSPAPDTSKMSLKEMETYLKSIGQWN